jgi:hypothetical protein
LLDFFIGGEDIVSVVREHSFALDLMQAGGEFLNSLGNPVPMA